VIIKLYYRIKYLLHIISKQEYKRKTLRYSKRYRRIVASSFFDPDWYKRNYALPQIKDAALHYLARGARAGYDPGPEFSSIRFWSTFVTFDCVGKTALEHYESLKRYGVAIPLMWNKGYEKAYMPEHMPETAGGKGLILLATHELSLTGAPFILLETGKLLLGMGWKVAMLSPTDGLLRSACLEAGIPVYVTNGYLEKLPVKADFCICNTFLMHRFYMRWRFELPVMWWIHEMLVSRVVCEPLLLAMKYASELYVPSELTRKYLLAYSDNVRVLPQPLTDCGCVPAPKRGGKFRVAVIGSLCERKAQDVFIEAVRLLPERLKAGAEFEITGGR